MTLGWRRWLLIETVLLISLSCGSFGNDEGHGHVVSSASHALSKVKSPAGHENVVIVSLLNGDVCCLDHDTGEQLWCVRSGDKLLASSLSSLQVVYNGILTRIVPSLDGSLFRFQDDMFEPLPFTAESLLSSSFRLSGDSTIVGSKEVLTLGVSPTDGKLLYKCGKSGCQKRNEEEDDVNDMLVVKHVTHTIRAVSVRTGLEKWNFSVGYHDLKHVPKNRGADQQHFTCDGSDSSCTKSPGDSDLKFSVTDGLIARLSTPGAVSQPLVWQQRYDIPIAKAWRLVDGGFGAVNLLDTGNLFVDQRIETDCRASEDQETPAPPPPSVFVGVYEKQVYIQTSEDFQHNLAVVSQQYQHGFDVLDHIPKVKWAPYISTSPSRTPWLNHDKPALIGRVVENEAEHALAPFRPSVEYPYDNGFYLVSVVQPSSQDDGHLVIEMPQSDPTDSNESGFFHNLEDSLNFPQIVSLRYYWREVLAISVFMSFVVNITLWLTRDHRRRETPAATPAPPAVVDVTKTVDSAAITEPAFYASRYQSDFEHVQCLGKGGFGVVFHARNRIDECEYAIKRIALKNSNEAKERVTREVKALAKLDHQNIVRYFQSWFETPPVGWQEEQDKEWQNSEALHPTPLNSGQTFATQSFLASGDLKSKGQSDVSSLFVPRFKMDDESLNFSNDGRRAFDDSLDIVFEDSRSAGATTLTSPAFSKYSVAPVDSDMDSESGSDDGGVALSCNQLEDSGFQKYWLPRPETTGSFSISGSEDCDDLSKNKKPDVSCDTPQMQVTPTVTHHTEMGGPAQPKLFLYIQMQLCKRETLREYLSANAQSRDHHEVLHIFRQICDAVEYIHSQNLIHRDLKPTNIFFSLENTIKVGDFGLVTALSAAPPEPEVSSLLDGVGNGEPYLDSSMVFTSNVGTQLYMSPEQIRGGRYDSKVDIYALGLVLFELVHPFSTDMERIMTLQDLRKNKFPQGIRHKIPTESKLVQRMLKKSPTKRPTITEVKQSEAVTCRE